jgi:hypothetical protein
MWSHVGEVHAVNIQLVKIPSQYLCKPPEVLVAVEIFPVLFNKN